MWGIFVQWHQTVLQARGGRVPTCAAGCPALRPGVCPDCRRVGVAAREPALGTHCRPTCPDLCRPWGPSFLLEDHRRQLRALTAVTGGDLEAGKSSLWGTVALGCLSLS